MLRREDGLIKALKFMATAADGHLRFGAGRNSERFLRTVLPVVSDLIRTIGSSAVPTLVTVPPLGPLIDTRLALAML